MRATHKDVGRKVKAKLYTDGGKSKMVRGTIVKVGLSAFEVQPDDNKLPSFWCWKDRDWSYADGK